MSKSSLGMIAENWGAMQPSIREQLWATLSGAQREELGSLYPEIKVDSPPDANRAPTAKESPKKAKLPAPTPKPAKVEALASIPAMPDPLDWDDGLDVDRGGIFGDVSKVSPGIFKLKRTKPKQSKQTPPNFNKRPLPKNRAELADRLQSYGREVSIKSRPKSKLSEPLVYNQAPIVTQATDLSPVMDKLRAMELKIEQLQQSIAKPSLRADIITILRGGTQEPWHLASLAHSSGYMAHYGADAWERIEGDVLAELFKMRNEGMVKWGGGTTDKVKLRSMK